VEVPLVWHGPDGVTVKRTYVFQRGEFVVTVRHEVQNAGQRAWSGQLYRQLVRANVAHGSMLLPTYLGAAWYDGKYNKLSFDDMRDQSLDAVIQGGWIAMLEHYFVSAWIGDGNRAERVYSKARRAGIAGAAGC